jgi:hypothetical protein
VTTEKQTERSVDGEAVEVLAEALHDATPPENDGGVPDVCNRYPEHEAQAKALIAAGWHLTKQPIPDERLREAWDEAEQALGPRQRLVMWTEKDAPVYVQVTEPEDDTDDLMVPVLTDLAAYPSQGLGDIAESLKTVAKRLSGEPNGQ